MAASTRGGEEESRQTLSGEAGLINNLLLPQASVKGRLHQQGAGEEGKKGVRPWPPRSLAPQALTALAPVAQSPAAVPVS